MFEKIAEFEQALAKHTGAKYAVMTDCCTHAIELCFRYDHVHVCAFPAYTYLSIPQLMTRLGTKFIMMDEPGWTGEYPFLGTRIWDSARLLKPGMYRPGYLQCVSFGYGKPLQIGRGGAILLDDTDAYHALKAMRYDGRQDLEQPWHEQQTFRIGYHYKPTVEEAERGLELLPHVDPEPKWVEYPDCRKITIIP
jgi:dTDP-4-amino-4,6-dideoxygalactose transaminase